MEHGYQHETPRELWEYGYIDSLKGVRPRPLLVSRPAYKDGYFTAIVDGVQGTAHRHGDAVIQALDASRREFGSGC